MSHRVQSHPWARSAAVLLSLGLLAAACGEKNEGGSSGTGDPEDRSDITTGSSDEVAQEGGRMVYGLEAESDGFNPVVNRWAIAGVMVGTAVYDPLSAFDADRQVQPYLAESFDHNEDFTEWTIKIRDGVTFHNGEPLTSTEVAEVLRAHTKPGLTQFTVAYIDKTPGPDGQEGTEDDEAAIEVVDPLTLKVTMSAPWATFPSVLAGQVGVIPYPSVYDGSDEQGALNPVGTGPFVQSNWEPDTEWVGKKYEDYWQDGLPYLDEIVFKPIPEISTRTGALDSGEIQLFHTTDPEVILRYREEAAEGKVQIVEDQGEGEETFVLLNVESEPFDNELARQALAYATDKETYIATIAPGSEPANGPFSPDSPWYDSIAEETYPQFDLERARELVTEYEESTGKEFVVDLSNTTSTTSREQSNLLAEMWEAAGITVEKSTYEQTVHINNAILGTFNANAWRQFGEPDPDNGYHWWVGGSTLNFSKNADPLVDEAMIAARATDVEADRKAQYAIVQERFAIDLPYIWLHHTRWAVVAENKVRGITNGLLPDGEPSLPMGSGYSGTHRVVYLWLAD